MKIRGEDKIIWGLPHRKWWCKDFTAQKKPLFATKLELYKNNFAATDFNSSKTRKKKREELNKIYLWCYPTQRTDEIISEEHSSYVKIVPQQQQKYTHERTATLLPKTISQILKALSCLISLWGEFFVLFLCGTAKIIAIQSRCRLCADRDFGIHNCCNWWFFGREREVHEVKFFFLEGKAYIICRHDFSWAIPLPLCLNEYG